MILKHLLTLTTILWGRLLVTAYAEYDNEDSKIQTPNTEIKLGDIALLNEEIYNPGQLQQEAEPKDMIMDDMDYKTDVPIKNVRNISNNQLYTEYSSMEHEDNQEVGVTEPELKYDNNNYKQSSEQYSMLLNKEQEYDTESPFSKNIRTGRLFTPTTTVPEYINKLPEDRVINKPLAKDINVSNSDYVEEGEEVLVPKELTSTMPMKHINLDNSSEENDEIVPLAMKYYDDIPPENASVARHVEEVSSEDYYEEQYHDEELKRKATTTSTTTVQTPDNNILRSLFGGFTTTTTATYTTKAPTTPAPTPTSTPTLADNKPVIGQIDSVLLTTLSPLPEPPQTLTGVTTSRTAIAAASSSVVPNDKRGKHIPIISTIPAVTTTTTSTNRRRLLPHEQLRNFIEDAYIRMPLAVIVDPSVESLEKTKALWNDAMQTNLNIKIVLVTLNDSEETPAAFNFNNTRQFLAGLNSIKEQPSGDAFRGISHAAELVPYDSAVFLSTAQLAKHTDQVQDSAITLLKKRIRLYLIWFGERSLSENETQDSVGGILGEVAIRSGGEILHIVGSENSQELEGSTLTIVADALRGSQEVDVPVDTTLSSLHVKIDKVMRRAVLETPNGG